MKKDYQNKAMGSEGIIDKGATAYSVDVEVEHVDEFAHEITPPQEDNTMEDGMLKPEEGKQYDFPGEGFSVKADSLEEAIKALEEHKNSKN